MSNLSRLTTALFLWYLLKPFSNFKKHFTIRGKPMFLLFIAAFTYTNCPVLDMRSGPSGAEKVESQSYYSERVIVIEEDNNWAKIQTPDNVQGWVKKDCLHTSEEPYIDHTGAMIAMVNRRYAHLYGVKDTEYGPVISLPFESRLEVIDHFSDPSGRWLEVKLIDGKTAYIQRGDVVLNPKPMSKKEALDFSKHFIDQPYTWGGRSGFGYDCSGFVQMIYRQMGINIPRNSNQQLAWEGFKETSVNSMQPGDLIFFGYDSSRVNHVGLYLGNNQFIHATVGENRPYIRISNLNDSAWSGTGALKYRAARTLK
jgi:hypothetical protein